MSVSQDRIFYPGDKYIPVPSFLTSILEPSTIIINDNEHDGFMFAFGLDEYMIDYLSDYFKITIPKEILGEDRFEYSGQFVVEQDWTKGIVQSNSDDVDNILVELTRGDITNILYEIQTEDIKLYDIYGRKIEFKKSGVEPKYISVPFFLRFILEPSDIIIDNNEHEGFMLGFKLTDNMIDYLSDLFNITIPKEHFGTDQDDYAGQFVIEQDWRKGLIQRNPYADYIDNIFVELTKGDIIKILYELRDQNIELYDIYNDQIEFKTDLD